MGNSQARHRDLHWRVAGHGLDRVATTRFQDHTVRVRRAVVDQAEIWVLDVDDLRCCGQYVSRTQALSGQAVSQAVEIAHVRSRRAVPPIGRNF